MDIEITRQRLSNIVGITPCTPEARAWIDDNVQAESWQWQGETLCIDGRYADDLIEGLIGDGFEVS